MSEANDYARKVRLDAFRKGRVTPDPEMSANAISEHLLLKVSSGRIHFRFGYRQSVCDQWYPQRRESRGRRGISGASPRFVFTTFPTLMILTTVPSSL